MTRKPDKRVTFGTRLKDAREHARLSRAQLAEKVGASESTIRGWEAGHRIARDPFKIADALGVDPYWLTDRPKPKIELAENGTAPK